MTDTPTTVHTARIARCYHCQWFYWSTHRHKYYCGAIEIIEDCDGLASTVYPWCSEVETCPIGREIDSEVQMEATK